MQYIEIATSKYPVSMREIKASYPNVSLPSSMSDDQLETLGYAHVRESDKPDYNHFAQKIVEGDPVERGGEYLQTWLVVDLAQDEIFALMNDRQKALTEAVQHMLDEQSRAMGYDNIITASTYASSTIDKFRGEAVALISWRDQVWTACYAILDDVLAGKRQIPSLEQLVQDLPKFEVINDA